MQCDQFTVVLFTYPGRMCKMCTWEISQNSFALFSIGFKLDYKASQNSPTIVDSYGWGPLCSQVGHLPILLGKKPPCPINSWVFSHKLHVWDLPKVSQWYRGQETVMAAPQSSLWPAAWLGLSFESVSGPLIFHFFVRVWTLLIGVFKSLDILSPLAVLLRSSWLRIQQSHGWNVQWSLKS